MVVDKIMLIIQIEFFYFRSTSDKRRSNQEVHHEAQHWSRVRSHKNCLHSSSVN